MKPIDYFKLQSKNLHKDYKTQTSFFDTTLSRNLYRYNPKYFDIDRLIIDDEVDENNFTLMKAQHIIAQWVGFSKWTEMLKASDIELELAKLLFDNMDKISVEEWNDYIFNVESDNNITFDLEGRLEVFKQVFAHVDGHLSLYTDYRLNSTQKLVTKSESPHQVITKPVVKITSLPLEKQVRDEFIEKAKSVFETVMLRMKPHHPEIIRKLWNPEFYVDKVLVSNDMLPIDREYALSMIDTFLVHDVLELAIQADKIAVSLN
ncbi:hypothetical protein [Arcicella rosea]|uniref:Uncharacterized protein n=1 Tax=Arcicella rosea TaxID=502909 RepID=A0A841EMA9_9BACT|nr:hypothetical protein [Arcicella rosea]MBB6001450.1 hypothetical protein [Arcicella rosea]